MSPLLTDASIVSAAAAAVIVTYVLLARLIWVKDGNGRSPDPADPEQTFRVLTLYAVDDILAYAH